jgi:hypothetical protein
MTLAIDQGCFLFDNEPYRPLSNYNLYIVFLLRLEVKSTRYAGQINK